MSDEEFQLLVVDNEGVGTLVAYQHPKKPNPAEWIGALILAIGFWWILTR